MSTALSKVHLYLNATVDSNDGVIASESQNGEPKLFMSAFRGGTSNSIKVAIRADSKPCYLVFIKIVGDNADKVFLSTNNSNWKSILYFNIIDIKNTIFFVKTEVGDFENFGDDTTTALTIEYFAPVNIQ